MFGCHRVGATVTMLVVGVFVCQVRVTVARFWVCALMRVAGFVSEFVPCVNGENDEALN